MARLFVSSASKIVAVGRNFSEHAKEVQSDVVFGIEFSLLLN
jgi:2-keto-4-pentenoate hydratase/2-oxohepta-3-ene-1,7-dioic acid hydratase in catechol pathway